MSFLKFSPNLFLEKVELDKLKSFLDDDGFRNFLIQNSASFGWIKKPNEAFVNGLVTQGSGLTVDIAESTLIDLNGNLIYSEAIESLAIPANNLWYWIKIVHNFSSQEVGTYSIDTLGNLVCTSSNGAFLSLLRGQPNYPSRVKFLNASLNILEYDVESVVDNNNAVLTGNFVAETDLTLSVIGTFTPGYVPITSEKNIFQYDSATISLVQSTTTTPPSHVTGLEFFIARVRNSGAALSIEDKRDEVWTTNSTYLLRSLALIGNPLIGVEQITFDDPLTPRSNNLVQIAWAFEATTFSVDLKLNKITISAGKGGKFKASTFYSDFTDGDFDGWRLYARNNKYFIVQSSAQIGSTIELSFDHLEATSFFSDVNSTTPISGSILVTPDAEEILIVCTPTQNSNAVANTSKIWLINERNTRVSLPVYDDTDAEYLITYAYKQVNDYSPGFTLPNDSVGYYDENQFNSVGVLVGSTQTPYSSGLITLIQASSAYSNVIGGDLLGVESLTLSNSTPLVELEVGVNKQYQHIVGGALTLSANIFINLKPGIKNGNTFFIHTLQNINLNGFAVYVVQDYVNPVTYTLIGVITDAVANFIKKAATGIFVRYTWTGSAWIINTQNEVVVPTQDWQTVGVASGSSYGTNWGASSGVDIRFKKDPFNKVWLSGQAQKNGAGNTICTLPAGYRPAVAINMLATWVQVSVFITINTNGTIVTDSSVTTGTPFFFDQISFPID